MSVELHRQAEFWMGEMDRARAKGNHKEAARCATAAAEYEEDAVAVLRAACPERERTIAIVEESARSLRALAAKYATTPGAIA